MKVFTYATTDPDAPAAAMARIYLGKIGKVHDWHPVIFHGSTEEGVRRQAEEWWGAEVAKVDKRTLPRGPKTVAEEIGDVL